MYSGETQAQNAKAHKSLQAFRYATSNSAELKIAQNRSDTLRDGESSHVYYYVRMLALTSCARIATADRDGTRANARHDGPASRCEHSDPPFRCRLETAEATCSRSARSIRHTSRSERASVSARRLRGLETRRSSGRAILHRSYRSLLVQ